MPRSTIRGAILPIGCSNSVSAPCDAPGRLSRLLTVGSSLLLFVIAAVWTDFSPRRVAEGLPRIGEYFGKLFSIEPNARRRPDLGAGLAASVRRREGTAVVRVLVLSDRRLLSLLWQTIQMAILATALGFAAPSRCAFPATQTVRRQSHGRLRQSAACWRYCAPSRRSCSPSSWSGPSASARWLASLRSPFTPPAHWESCSSS